MTLYKKMKKYGLLVKAANGTHGPVDASRLAVRDRMIQHCRESALTHFCEPGTVFATLSYPPASARRPAVSEALLARTRRRAPRSEVGHVREPELYYFCKPADVRPVACRSSSCRCRSSWPTSRRARPLWELIAHAVPHPQQVPGDLAGRAVRRRPPRRRRARRTGSCSSPRRSTGRSTTSWSARSAAARGSPRRWSRGRSTRRTCTRAPYVMLTSKERCARCTRACGFTVVGSHCPV